MQKLNLKPGGMVILFVFVAVSLAIVALAQWGIFDLSKNLTDIWTGLAAAFVLAEAGIVAMIKKKKLGSDYFRLFGVIVASVSLLALILSWVGITYTAVENMKGIINAIVVVFVIIEAFRK